MTARQGVWIEDGILHFEGCEFIGRPVDMQEVNGAECVEMLVRIIRTPKSSRYVQISGVKPSQKRTGR